LFKSRFFDKIFTIKIALEEVVDEFRRERRVLTILAYSNCWCIRGSLFKRVG